jgi:4-methyl-5(b-hydroxyethyl)-thiazole monophosphate biosynthesis
VLPGGLPGADHLNEDPRIHQLLKRLNAEGRYTAAICAAPKVLATAGLLNGRKATSYPGALSGMDLPRVDVQLERVVRDDKVVTSRGPGTAVDFALELVEILVGKAKREEVEKGLVR